MRNDLRNHLKSVALSALSDSSESYTSNCDWLLNFSFSPYKNNIGNHPKALSDFLDLLSSPYEKVLL